MSKKAVIYGTLILLGAGTVLALQYATAHPELFTTEPQIEFLDEVQANASPSVSFADFAFLQLSNEELALRELVGQKNLVVVILKGNTGAVCPYCSTQTSRLIANYDKFAERDTEVVVIYPIEEIEDRPAMDEFLAATRKLLDEEQTPVPFPLVLDVGLDAVDKLGLRAFLSKPATYILDRQGRVRFAYVGSSLADRPSIKAMLEQVDALAETSS